MTANTVYHFDGDPADETAWQDFVAEHRVPAAGEQQPVTTPATAVKQLVELFLLFVVMMALVGTVLWQKSATQIAAQEAELQRLQEQLATVTAQQETLGTAADVGHTAHKAPVLHILETDHLRLVVESENMDSVTANISRIDRSYRQIREDLELESITNAGKLTIYVTNYTDGYSTVPYDALGVIDIDMFIYAQPVTAETDVVAHDFAENLLRRLAQHTLDEALRTRVIKPKWDAMVENLYRHMVYDGQSYLPAELKSYAIQSRYLAQIYPLKTAELTLEPGDWMYPDRTVANAVADALVEYIFATYGRSSVPRLLNALSKHDDLDQVISAAFAIPADQFTTEWRTYLRLHYPIEEAMG